MRYCVSYVLNFLRSPEKASGAFILEYVSFCRTVGIVAVVVVLSVGLGARSLFLLVDIVAHSVTCIR
jgi:hypothetical protein